MFTITRHLVIGVAALAVASSALAGPQVSATTTTHSHTKQSAKSSAAPSAKPAAPTTLAATGKIVQFDAAAQALTLSTAKGDEHFTLDSTTRLRDASHSIAPADLVKLTGRQATVRYHDASGQKNVVSVRVSSAAPKAQTKH